MPIKPQVSMVVAVRAAYTITHIDILRVKRWYWMTGLKKGSLSQMGPFFKHQVENGGLLSEDEYQDFVGRLEFVWLMIRDTNPDDVFWRRAYET
jgi:hypothetical protein